jgi:hypothetical protein
MVTGGGDIDLEAALDNTDYTPSFAPKTTVKKMLNRA